MSSRPPLRIAIVGYGTAGQAAAILLTRDGHRVDVFERAPQLGPVGAGLLLQPTGLAVLWEMGLLETALTHGRRISRLHDEAQREHGPYDLVLAADGAASSLRAAVGTPRYDRPYPWGALWCLLPRGEWPHESELRQRYVAARKLIGMLPVGTRPDDATPRVSFFWSLPSADFDAWSARGLAAWLEEIAALWPQALACMSGVTHCGLLARASYRDAVLDRWYRNRLVLIGDAAHAMSPQLGQGVNMALMDALALRDALRAEHDVDTALARYEHERRAHVRIYQFWSRWLTPLFQSERDFVARCRDLAFAPLGRLPGGRGMMLRVLSGTQHGWFGKLRLPQEFLRALQSPA